MAERHGLPLDQLNNALYYGQISAYERYLKFIRNGRSVWVGKARDLAKKINYPIEGLEAAIEEGKKVKPALPHRVFLNI